jgi:hypothetical protein
MLLLIGSRALHNYDYNIRPANELRFSDWDFIADQGSWNSLKSQMFGVHVHVNNPDVQAFKCMHQGRETYFEAYIVPAITNVRELTDSLTPEDFTSSYRLLQYAKKNVKRDRLTGFYCATADMCLAIKMSHRFLKNNPFFNKTMHDIQYLRREGVTLNEELQDIMFQRQKETLAYNHPKLDVSKSEFFNDSIYTYDHDTIHETVALADRPAYTFYMKDNSQVMTSREKFEELPEIIKLSGVYEETCVLALERSQIPNNFEKVTPRQSFMMALEKVCTSITSGWFREYAWENYHQVVSMYKTLGSDDYVQRFKRNQHLLKPFK